MLRSPEEIKRKLLDREAGEYSQPYSFSCDPWNYFFLAVTGVAAPNVEGGCSPQGPRGQTVSFEEWFA